MEIERKPYDTPHLDRLGSVQELTALVRPPSDCSALPSDQSTEDFLCDIPVP